MPEIAPLAQGGPNEAAGGEVEKEEREEEKDPEVVLLFGVARGSEGTA